ncbi:MAG: hypothetical protein QT00_C0003G0014 [archaeon GW2011_AR5]|nr:MAG: hypothetical protein QT00_C0003G0014 [archaeon GW2011_AR5]
MAESFKKLSFAEDGKDKENDPMTVENVLKRLNLPTLLEGTNELNSKTVVDVDTRALRQKECPLVIFGRPHVGEFVPTEILSRMQEGGVKMSAMFDRGTQAIFKTEKVPSSGFKISRWVVDPNRAPDPNVKNAVPGHVLWKQPAIDKAGQLVLDASIYEQGQEPSDEEIRNLVERFYIPYYNSLMSLVGAVADRRTTEKQRVLFLDGHSFPSIGRNFEAYYKSAYDLEDPGTLPLFILGDRSGTECDLDIREGFGKAIERQFAALSKEDQEFLTRNFRGEHLVGYNDPFKGVHNVMFFGEREKGVNALQLELNESMYTTDTDDNWFQFNYEQRGLDLVRGILERASLDVDVLLKAGEKIKN